MTECLVYHTGALGDFLTTLPALGVVRRTVHPTRIVLLGRPAFGALAREQGYVDETWNINAARYASLFADMPPTHAAQTLRRFGMAVVFTGRDSPIIGALKAAGIEQLWRQDSFPSDETHVIDYHLSLFAPAEINGEDRRLRLHRSWIDVDGRKGPIVLHPGSGSRLKNWPPERFAALTEELLLRGRTVTWLLGPAEHGLGVPTGVTAVQKPSLADVAGLLRRCALYVGNDSGISHLAAAIGCPCLVLFGPSDPRVWAPRGPRVEVIHTSPDCGPCHGTGGTRAECPGECMNRIEPSVALERCLHLLDIP